jgi:hypothetical protein
VLEKAGSVTSQSMMENKGASGSKEHVCLLDTRPREEWCTENNADATISYTSREPEKRNIHV